MIGAWAFLTGECSLDGGTEPTSPSGPGSAPRAPASQLAPHAVAIETGSPHKNQGTKKEAPEIWGLPGEPVDLGQTQHPGPSRSPTGTQPPPQAGVHSGGGKGLRKR